MSRTIDEKIVEMRFDNKDFEKNVSESMSTLDKLKSALNFSSVEDSFSGVSSAIDGVKGQFSALETVAMGALMNIGAKIENFVEKQVKSLTIEPVIDGFEKYGNKTQSVQMIMNATGKEIGEVSDQLQRLNWYTDETSYAFTEMVASIGKFTSNGIELDKAVTAMEGIANWAGVSGANKQEANRAMYNISQALAGGYMRLQDWKSIENANMATKEFKESVIQMAIEMGTLEEAVDEAGNAIYGFTKSNGAFQEVNFQTMSQTLSEGKWLTNDVLTATLAIYGEFTDELSKVYDDMNETVDITTSEIIGYVNQWMDGTIDWAEAMEATGKSAEELEVILSNLGKEEYALGRKAFAAAQEAKTFGEAIEATQDAVSTAWMNTFEILFGNYEEAKVLWTDLANELWDIFAGPISDMNEVLGEWADPEGLNGREILIDSIKNIYRALRSLSDPIAEAWEKIFPSVDAEGLLDITKRFHDFTQSLILGEDEMRDVYRLFESIFSVVKLVKDGVGELIGAFSSGLSRGKKGFFEGLQDTIKNVSWQIREFVNGIKTVKNMVEGFKMKLVSEEEINNLKAAHPVLYGIVDVFERMKEAAQATGLLLGKIFNLENTITKFKDAGGGIAGVTAVIFSNLKDVLKTAQKLVQIWTGINIGNVVKPITDAIDFIQDKIKAIQDSGIITDIKNKIGDIAKTFEDRFGSIASWFSPLLEAGKSIWNDFIEGLQMLSGYDGGGMESLFDSIRNGLDSIKEFINTSPRLKAAIDTFKDIISIFADFLADFFSFSGAIKTFQAAGGGLSGVLAVLNDKLGSIFGFVSDIFSRITGQDISGIGNSALLVIRAIEEGLAHIANFIAKLFGWNDNPFAEFLGTSSGALDILYDKLNSLGGDGEKAPIASIFEKIGGAFTKLWETLKEYSPQIAKVFGFVVGIIKSFIDIIKEMSLSDILDVAKVLVLLYVGKQLGDLFASLTDTFDAFQKSLKAEAIKSIAVSILAVAGAAYLIAQIDKEKVLGVIGVIAASMAGLIGLMAVSRIANFKALSTLPGILLALSVAMFAFSQSIDPVITAVERLADLDLEKMIQGISGFAVVSGVFLGMIALAGKASANAEKFYKTFTSISSAMLILFVTIELFRLLKWEDIIESLKKMVTVLGTLGGAIVVFSVFEALISKLTKGKGITAFTKSIKEIAKAMLILVATIAIVNLISMENFAEGILKIVTALLAIGAVIVPLSLFSKPLSKFADVLYKFGKALLFISGVIAIFGLISTVFGDFANTLIQNGVDLIVNLLSMLADRTPDIADSILRIVIGILDAVAARTPEIIAAVMSIVVSILTEIGNSLQSLDPEPFLKGTAFLAGIIAAMLGIKALGGVSIKDFLKTVGVVAEAALVMIEIVGVLAGIGWLMQQAKEQLNWDMVESVEYLGEVLEAISNIMFSKFGIIILAVTGLIALIDNMNKSTAKDAKDTDKKSGLKEVSKMILEVAVVISEIVLAFGVLGEAVSALDKGLSSFNNLGKGEGESGWLGGENGGGKGLVELITDLGTVLETIANVLFSKVGIMLAAIAGIMVLFDKFNINSTMGGLEATMELILGVGAAIAEIIGIFVIIGEAVATVDQGLKWLNDQDFMGSSFKNSSGAGMNVIDLITYLGEVLNAIADVFGGIIGHFVGSIIVGGIGEGFAEAAEGYAQGLKTVCTTMSEVPDDVVTKANLAANMFSTLMMAIPNEGGLLGWIIGNKEEGMANISEQLPTLAEGLKKFSENLSGFDPSIVESSKAGVDIILEIAKATPRDGGLWQMIIGSTSQGMSGLKDNLADFATALVNYSTNINGLNSQAVADSKAGVDIVLSIARAVPKEGGLWQKLVGSGTQAMSDLKTTLPDFASSLVSYSKNLDGFKSEAVEDSKKGAEIILDLAKSIPGSGGLWDDIFGSKVDGMDGLKDSLPKFGHALLKYSKYMVNFEGDAVEKSKKGAEVAVELSKSVPTSGGLWDKLFGSDAYNDMKDFAQALPEFGKGLADFSQSVSQISENMVIKTGYALSVIDDIYDAKNSSKGVADFGSNIKKYFNEIKDVNVAQMESVAAAVSHTWNLMFNIAKNTAGVNYMEEYENIAEYSMKGYSIGVEKSEERVNSAVGNVMDSGISTARRSLEERSPSRVFMEIGEYAAEGFAIGIADGENTATESVTSMANAIADTITDILQIHSPSQLFELFAQMCTQGFADGIFDGIPNIDEALKYMGESILNGKSLTDIISNAKDMFGIDMTSIFGAQSIGTLSDAFKLEALTGGNFNLEDYLGGTLSLDNFSQEYIDQLESLNFDSVKDTIGNEMESAFEEGATDIQKQAVVDSIMNTATKVGSKSGEAGGEAAIDSAVETVKEEADRAGEIGETIVGSSVESSEAILDTTEAQYENKDIQGPTVTPVVDTSEADEELSKWIDEELSKYNSDMFTTYRDDVIAINGHKALNSWSSWKSYKDYEAEVMAKSEEKAIELAKARQEAAEAEKEAAEATNADTTSEVEVESVGDIGYTQETKEAVNEVIQNEESSANERFSALMELINYNNEVSDILARDVAQIGETVTSIEEKVNNAEIYLDGKTLVGAMVDDIDKALGSKSTLAGRRV